MHFKRLQDAIKLSLLIIILFGSFGSGAFAKSIDQNTNNQVFLPIILSPKPPKVMLGVYTDGYLGLPATIENEVKAIEYWSNKKISLIGTFIAFEDLYPDYNIPVPLGLIWDNGYIPFVNIETQKKLSDINNGSMDNQIRAMARAFRKWHEEGIRKNQNRVALVAPLQEMNGYWVSYHGDPGEFKTAFSRIQRLFEEEGADQFIKWVFAPNGWSSPNDPPLKSTIPVTMQSVVLLLVAIMPDIVHLHHGKHGIPRKKCTNHILNDLSKWHHRNLLS